MTKKPSKTRNPTQAVESTTDPAVAPVIRKALIAAGELVLILRCVRGDMTSRNGFRWPEHGDVSAPDWEPTKECGSGLHGWLWGAGDLTGACNYWSDEDTRWLVVEVAKSDLIDLDGKVKYPRGVVVFCGYREEAVSLIVEHAPAGMPVMFGTATAGYGGTATAGDRGTATAGDGGTATAGDGGTATAGDRGTATAGYGGTATAGDRGTATAGYGGTATAGDGGTATAGYGGTVAIEYHDARYRYRKAIAAIDADGEYKPGVAYVVVDGRIVAKEDASK